MHCRRRDEPAQAILGSFTPEASVATMKDAPTIAPDAVPIVT